MHAACQTRGDPYYLCLTNPVSLNQCIFGHVVGTLAVSDRDAQVCKAYNHDQTKIERRTQFEKDPSFS